jgi:uncharacterized membrane protein YbhN (UPF0104 family)
VLTLSDSKRQWLWSTAKVLYYLLFAIALMVIGGYLWENRAALNPIWHAPTVLWLIPVLLYLGTLIAKGLSFDILVRVYDVRMPLLDSVGLTASGLLANYAVPGNASLPLRTLYMHRVLGLHYKDFVPIALAAFLFSLGLYGVFAGIAAFIFGKVPSHAYAIAILAFSGGGLALVLALALPYHALPLIGPRIESLLSGWRRLCRSRHDLAHWLGVVVLLSILEIGLFYSIVRILSIELTVVQTAIIVLAKECSVILRITPGGFGVAEGVQVFFGTQFGVEVSLILLAALIARAIELLTISSVSLALSGRLARKIAVGTRDSNSRVQSH